MSNLVERLGAIASGLSNAPIGVQKRDVHDAASHLTELEEEKRQLGDLLAVIHSDGGHYQAKHGTAKAVKDAIEIRTKLVTKIDELEEENKKLKRERDEAVTRVKAWEAIVCLTVIVAVLF